MTSTSSARLSLVEDLARALCVQYSGDPDAEYCGRPMWRHFSDDAEAMMPVVVRLANEIADRFHDHAHGDDDKPLPAAVLKRSFQERKGAKPGRSAGKSRQGDVVRLSRTRDEG